MKTTSKRIQTEKQLWLDLFIFFKRQGYNPKWEIASHAIGKQKVWDRLEAYHDGIGPSMYGFSFSVGRIGNQELRFCVEMQNELKFGLRFREGIAYWTEAEIQDWGELTIRMDGAGVWDFDLIGWFATRNLPVRLNMVDPGNSAAYDLVQYKDDSYAKLLITDALYNNLHEIKQALRTPKTKKYGTYIN